MLQRLTLQGKKTNLTLALVRRTEQGGEARRVEETVLNVGEEMMRRRL